MSRIRTAERRVGTLPSHIAFDSSPSAITKRSASLEYKAGDAPLGIQPGWRITGWDPSIVVTVAEVGEDNLIVDIENLATKEKTQAPLAKGLSYRLEKIQ